MAGALTGCVGAGGDDDGAGDAGATDDAADVDADADAGSDADADADAGADSGDDGADDGTGAGTGGSGEDLHADLLLSRLPGLWVAGVTSDTSVGDFPVMNMDVRAVDDRTLFSRVDLDADNNLRFLFTYEDHPDLGRTLVFRNGGFFVGLLRDSRTHLVEFDDTTDTWRFCSIPMGCMYIDARFSVTEAGELDLDVNVLGMHHIHWAPTRVEERGTEASFDGAGGADDPFPTMPTLTTTVSWTDPAAGGEAAWLMLFTEPCMIAAASQCNPARFYRASVPAGTTSVDIEMDQIHPGEYLGLAILDANDNLGATLIPDSGDVVSLPNVPITVNADGDSTATVQVMVHL